MPLHILKDQDELNRAAADWMVGYIHQTVKKKDRFTLVLSGGNTPKKLHELLATAVYKDKIAWNKIHFFWGDERFVPFNDSRNNARMGFDTLLNHIPAVKEQIHIMETEAIAPEESAKAYESILRNYFPGVLNDLVDNASEEAPASKVQTFDLVLLGIGDDGHTLSLFPGQTEVIHETRKWCASLWLDAQDMHRITLTPPVVNLAAAVAFLVTGSAKARALHQVLKGNYNPVLCPSQIIKPSNGEMHWFVDEEAALLL